MVHFSEEIQVLTFYDLVVLFNSINYQNGLDMNEAFSVVLDLRIVLVLINEIGLQTVQV